MLPAPMDGHPTAAIPSRDSQPNYLLPIHNYNLLLFRLPTSTLPPSSLNQFPKTTLLTSRRTDLNIMGSW